ncbi:phosphate ABC transporter permease [Haloarchaeobius sp. HRN-SO-5]|uniref:phosphate ABC transporter permease n=1 Tax=Haloarchaeobius sp. HRN-SO-5 TaxID=3446118 RepID=UPI003EBF6D52
MSTEPATTDEERDGEYAGDPSSTRFPDALRVDRERVVVATGGVASLAVVGTTAVRTLYNLPFDPVPVAPGLRSAVAGTTLVVLAASLVALSVATGRSTVRVGLLFAGVFGVLPALARAATLPGALGVAAGSGVALAGTLGVPSSYRAARRGAVALAFVAGIAVSLGAAIGVVDAGLRSLGGLFAVGALVGTGVRIEGDRVGVAAGVLAFLATTLAVGANPYVAGSALLVAFAVVGVPHLLVAAAAGSCVGVAVAGVRRAEYETAAGACILLAAGIPATFPRAMAVLLGATLVLFPVETLAGPVGTAGEEVPP